MTKLPIRVFLAITDHDWGNRWSCLIPSSKETGEEKERFLRGSQRFAERTRKDNQSAKLGR